MSDTDELVPIKKVGKETYLFVGKRADDGDDEVNVMLTKANSEEEAEKIFMKELGTEAEDLDEESENESACITIYKIAL